MNEETQIPPQPQTAKRNQREALDRLTRLGQEMGGPTLPPPITDGRDPGDEQPEIPMRCPTCDRYCGGRCPTAIHKEKS